MSLVRRLAGIAVLGATTAAFVLSGSSARAVEPAARSVLLSSSVVGEASSLVAGSTLTVRHSTSDSGGEATVDLPAGGSVSIPLADDQTEMTLSVSYPAIEGVQFGTSRWNDAGGGSVTAGSYTIAFAVPVESGQPGATPAVVPVALQSTASAVAVDEPAQNVLSLTGSVVGDAAETVGATPFTVSYDVDGDSPVHGETPVAPGQPFSLDVLGDAGVELALTKPAVPGVQFGATEWFVGGSKVGSGDHVSLAFATPVAGARAAGTTMAVEFRVPATSTPPAPPEGASDVGGGSDTGAAADAGSPLASDDGADQAADAVAGDGVRELAMTGSPSLPFVVVGTALTGAGVALVSIAWRRRAVRTW